MALNLARWLKYAQAKLSGAVDSGNRELDQLEAEREAEIADRPWLASDGEAPTLDEARARIEWEAAEQQRRADAIPQATTSGPAPSGPPASPAAPPQSHAMPSSGDDAEQAAARVELDRRDREARERLDAIRTELGVMPTKDDPTP